MDILAPPAANGTSSPTRPEWVPGWFGGTFVPGSGYQHSPGIS